MVKKSNTWVVSFNEDRMRLSLFIKQKTKSKLSNRQIKNALEKGICKVNNHVETFSSRKLRKGDEIILEDRWESFAKEKKEIKKIKKNPKKLYEDDYFIIIDKPSNLLCLDIEIQKYFPKSILVHRLDRQTSGILILAKSEKVKSKMKHLFKEKKVLKKYIAIVDGKILKKRQTIKTYLAKRKDFKGKIQWGETNKKGLLAISTFETIKKRNFYSVVKCLPLTGRTHQLRLHLLKIGHPILGDYQYFRDFKYPNFIPRLMLHCYEISFDHPFLDKKIKVKSALPKEFKGFVSKI